MRYTTLLIVSEHMCNLHTIDIPYLLVQEPTTFINDHVILCNNEEVSFDYLLVTNLDLITNSKLVPFIIDHYRLLTNYYYQTNIEHIYFFEYDLSFPDKLLRVCNHIQNIE